MKKLLGIALLFLGMSVQAQTVKGTVEDENGEPLLAATVMILQQKDSVLASFAVTDQLGKFEIKNVARGAYILRINFVGYEAFNKAITVAGEDIQIGKVEMKVALMEELVVEAEADPITLKQDTIEYNAASFKTRTNASVEDLLKKLPGLEVDREGNITAEGESVNRVLVDGKEFFGDNPKMATKNLPAESVDKIQVFDQKSRFAQFTGIDDDNDVKTINLSLKDSHKRGTFGTIRGGYGTDERYDAGASINQFRDDNQFSFIGNLNNNNNAGDTQSQQGGFGGGGGSNSNTGFVTTRSGGLNYNRDYEKVKIRSNYNINQSEGINITETERTNFQNDGSFDTNSSSDSRSKSTAHELNLTAEYKFDDTQDLQIENRVSFTDSESSSISATENIELGTVLSSSSNDQNTESNSHNINSTLTYRKKLGKPGRSVISELSFSDQDNDSNVDLYSVSDLGSGDQIVEQDRITDNYSTTIGAELSYTEPIGTNKYLEVRYERNLTDGGNNAGFYDLTEAGLVFNEAQSSFYERKYDYSRVGMTFNYRADQFSVNFGSNYQFSELEGIFPESDQENFVNEFNRVLPFARINYNGPNGMTGWRLNYTTALNEPSITQLQPVPDYTDSLNITVGNPELNAEYSHRFRLRFRFFDQFTQTTLFAFVNYTYTLDDIITSRTIDDESRAQTTMPVNARDAHRWQATASFSRPFRAPLFKDKFRLNLNNSWTDTRNFTVIDEVFSETRTINNTVRVSVENIEKELVDWAVGLTYNTGKTEGANSDANQDFTNQTYYADLTFFFTDKLSLTSKFDFENYGSASFAGDQVVRLWQASIQQNFLKNDRGELKLSAFDILNENRGISRNTNVNYIEEQRTASIGTYYMLTFTYRLSAFGDNDSTSFGFPGGGRNFNGPR